MTLISYGHQQTIQSSVVLCPSAASMGLGDLYKELTQVPDDQTSLLRVLR
jgi:hypothetical protein